jgi:transcriptional regulator with XRE-family HTH domain
MPKKPSHQSILREIRHALNWTQLDLSSRLGLTLSAINRYENGTLRVGRTVALRLSWATGVPYQDILANRPGPPWTKSGPLSPEILQHLDEQARNRSDKDLEKQAENYQYRGELLLKAAREYAPRKLWTVDAAIEAAFDELEKEFELTDAVKEIRGQEHDPNLVKWAEKNLPVPQEVRQEAQAGKRKVPARVTQPQQAGSAKTPAPRPL